MSKNMNSAQLLEEINEIRFRLAIRFGISTVSAYECGRKGVEDPENSVPVGKIDSEEKDEPEKRNRRRFRRCQEQQEMV